ncbi:MAG: hypothetical protein K9M54_07420 [Kiritimatiellales bacterium]|nr:hypothetical protein [Kiritimatiellales bacterium]MCF7863709.1 hypothetical protein [Kiritimatiellales bacterium]
MRNKKPSPFQASFLLTDQEKIYVLVVCGIFLIGLCARHFYLINETATVYTSAGIEQTENGHE